MGQLAGLSGPAFDPAFLKMKIGHHFGATTMSRAERAQRSGRLLHTPGG